MPNWIYADHFRGFRDTYIPLKDVNFLVGENSTGKTSILSLIILISSPDFWFDQDFNTDVVKIGGFRDIASVQQKGKKFFRIGFISSATRVQSRESGNLEALLMTFEERDNSPILRRLNYLSLVGQISAVFSRNQIRYKMLPIRKADDLNQASVFRTFRKWTQDSKLDLKGYRVLSKEFTFPTLHAAQSIDRILHAIVSESTNRKYLYPRNIPPFFLRRMAWLAPIRSRPKRTYDEYKLDFNPEGEHTPYLIRRLLKQKKSPRDFLAFIEKFGVDSGLFESIEIKGYGKEVASPFELRVILHNLHLAVVNVGYGISQALPVVVEMFSRPKGFQFVIQQPEVHLHPKAQAALGDVIFKLATEENKKFFIETHSDYTIDRFRLNFRDYQGDARPASQVLFFGRNEEGNFVVPVEILENGEYSDDQPKAFREFFIHEQLSLLGL